MKQRTTNAIQGICANINTWSQVQKNSFTHHSSFINHLIKYVDEDVVSDWLQASSAVVTVWGAEDKKYSLIFQLFC